MTKRRECVTPRNGDSGARNEPTTSVHPAQTALADAIRAIAIGLCSEVVIHLSNGETRERNSYGNDPHLSNG